MSGGWIEWRDFEVKYRGNAAQVDYFRPSKKFRQGIVGCSEKKKTFAEMRNEIPKANALKRAVTEKQEELDKALAKKKFLLRKKICYKW